MVNPNVARVEDATDPRRQGEAVVSRRRAIAALATARYREPLTKRLRQSIIGFPEGGVSDRSQSGRLDFAADSRKIDRNISVKV